MTFDTPQSETRGREGHTSFERREEESRENRCLDRLRFVTHEVYPKIEELHRLLTVQDDVRDVARLEQVWEEIVVELHAGEVCGELVRFMREFQKDPLIGGYIEHDLGNVASVLPELDLMRRVYTKMKEKGEPVEKNFRYLLGSVEAFVRGWPVFAYIFEDIVSRKIETQSTEKEEREAEPFRLDFVKKALETIRDSRAVDGKVKEKMNLRWGANVSLQADEEIDCDPAVVTNAVVNMIRNAARENVGATRILVSVNREGNALAIRVYDNGNGMPEKFLDEEGDAFIFRKGVSHSGSTGLGLADLPERLPEDVEFSVVSREKDVAGKFGQAHAYGMNGGTSMDIDETKDFATIFEFRLPIVRRQAAEQAAA